MRWQRNRRKAVWLMEFAGLGLILAAVAGRVVATPQASPADPFDALPGFGRSAEASLRDDTIALWEAFRREVLVESCMGQAGFQYQPNAEYPADALRDVAKGLGVAPAAGAVNGPADVNAAYEQSLKPEAHSAYVHALYGVTLEAMEAIRSTGKAPTADGGWGGCMGRADASSPSIWDARHHLLPLYVEFRRSLAASPDLAKARDEYAACAAQQGVIADRPGALDQLAAAGRIDEALAGKVASGCEPGWVAAAAPGETKLAEAFISEHREELAVVKRRYEGVLDRIAKDDGFAAFLATAMAANAAHEDEQVDGAGEHSDDAEP